MEKKENQNAEFKESWRDEYLKTISAFANTQGGILHIGIDDSGNAVGVANCKKLLDDIPNQIKHGLGLIPEVKSMRIKSKDCIIIKVKASENPVSYKGKFYQRSGSTTQELNSHALQQFLLGKSNLTWESIVEAETSVQEMEEQTILEFRKLADKRFGGAIRDTSTLQLLEKLHLLGKGRKLTRAAILLFGKDPQKYYPSSYIKIGRFKDDANIVSMDEIRGNLFQQAVGALEVLKKKYLQSDVVIEGLYRTELPEIPEAALREAIINAIVHKDYAEACTQVKIYPDSISIWNNGELNYKLTIEKLKKKHASFSRNELIAETFFQACLIEKWGYGTVKIMDECTKAGLPDPLFELSAGGMQLTFLKDILNEEYLRKLQLNDRQINAVLFVKEYGTITNSEYQKLTNASKRTVTTDLQVLTEKGLLFRTGATGKGTRYSLPRGSKGAKGAMKAKGNVEDQLESKLRLLEKDLDRISTDEEIKWHFSMEILIKIFDSWLDDFLKLFIPTAQKFNKYFTQPRHFITIVNGIASVNFSNENHLTIINTLEEQCQNYKQSPYEASVNITLNYGTFRKGGLKTFGCMYGFEIKFDMTKYSISADQFTEDNVRSRLVLFERLLHKPVSAKEISVICKQMGDTIYKHIDFYTKKEGLRK